MTGFFDALTRFFSKEAFLLGFCAFVSVTVDALFKLAYERTKVADLERKIEQAKKETDAFIVLCGQISRAARTSLADDDRLSAWVTVNMLVHLYAVESPPNSVVFGVDTTEQVELVTKLLVDLVGSKLTARGPMSTITFDVTMGTVREKDQRVIEYWTPPKEEDE